MGLPSKDEILAWVRDNPDHASKRDIARAFGIKGAERVELKALLKGLAAEGLIEGTTRKPRVPGSLPPVAVLRVLGPDDLGDLMAEPAQWDGEGPPPRILVRPRPGDPALGEGDRILAKLHQRAEEGFSHDARLIRRIASGPRKLLGVFRARSADPADGGRVVPVDKKSDLEWLVPAGETAGAEDGELVEAEQMGPRARLGLPKARIAARLGDPTQPKSFSLIAIHQHGIPDVFPEEALAEAEAAQPVALEGREDLRDVPLITIDPSDARDHDDAVAALPDPDPKNEGGHILWVAIADVAHYVRPGGAIDAEARRRGNSTYFPDRVVPMLPEALSGDLCSLHEGVERPCIALRVVLAADGSKKSHRFLRGLMRSPASLTYGAAQAAADGRPDAATEPLAAPVIAPLWAAYRALHAARERRQPLDLDLPERRIVLSETGKVTSVAFRERLEAHRLIEEFMILANVAAAETLEAKKSPLIYRVHEEPAEDRLEALRQVADSAGLVLAKGQVLKTRHLNALLDGAAGTDASELINLSVLRSMMQAYYAPQNFGHFGLALPRYAHFTSPIRRYADLIVHRALITAHGWGADGLTPADTDTLDATAEAISKTERRSMEAERDTNDRYLAAFLKDRVGKEFAGKVSGVARFGLFVRLEETGADGLVPISTLGDEYFHHDKESQTLMGERSGKVIGLGQPVTVRLAEAVPVTGGLLFDLVSLDGEAMSPQPRRGRRPGGHRAGSGAGSGAGPSPRRKLVKSRIRRAKADRKTKRGRG